MGPLDIGTRPSSRFIHQGEGLTDSKERPTITGATRAVSPNSLFRGHAEVLPGGDKPVILIYWVASR
jgi:hypothetical protein